MKQASNELHSRNQSNYFYNWFRSISAACNIFNNQVNNSGNPTYSYHLAQQSRKVLLTLFAYNSIRSMRARPLASVAARLCRTYMTRYESLATFSLLTCVYVVYKWSQQNESKISRFSIYDQLASSRLFDIKRLDTNHNSGEYPGGGADDAFRNDPPSIDRKRHRFSSSTTDRALRTWHSSNEHFAFYAAQGPRPYMEDRMDYVCDSNGKWKYFAIYDGHGGKDISEFLENHCSHVMWSRTNVDQHAYLSPEDIRKIIISEIETLDKSTKFSAQTAKTAETAGSTLVSVMLYNNQVFVANVGDSRAIMCDKLGKAHNITIDHKPDDAKERARIEAAGGFIQHIGVWRVGGMLATSRAIGDHVLKVNKWLSATPDVFHIPLDASTLLDSATNTERLPEPEYLVLASDGVWDVLGNQDVCNIINKHRDSGNITGVYEGAAKEIVTTSLKKGSLDNVSVLIVQPGALRVRVSTLDAKL